MPWAVAQSDQRPCGHRRGFVEVALQSRRRPSPRRAHLVLIPNPPHHPQGDFTLRSGWIGNGPAPRYTYAGISVLSPRLVAPVAPGGKAQLAPLLREAAEKRLVSGQRYDGVWHDVGTPERLAQLESVLSSRHETH